MSVLRRTLSLAILGLAASAPGFASEAEDQREIFDRCMASAERAKELAAGDRLQREKARSASVAVPVLFGNAMPRLLKAARLPKGLQVELIGVDTNGSASALGTGTIFVSSRLWRSSLGLEPDEAAAILAHELAHIELAHSRIRMCEAVAAAGDEAIALAAASQAVQQRIWSGREHLAVDLMKNNHGREYEADRRGAEILRAAGYSTAAVAGMLVKLARISSSTYSWSHPAMEMRLEQLAMKGHNAPF